MVDSTLVFHHVGVATRDIIQAIDIYTNLGYQLSDDKIYSDPIQKVRIALMESTTGPMIELLAPDEDKSPIDRILDKNGSTPYHTCYEVFDLDGTITYFKKQKFISVVEPVPAVAFNNRLISFLYHQSTGLIELLQR